MYTYVYIYIHIYIYILILNVLKVWYLGFLPELPFGSGLIWVLARLFGFEATSPLRFVYSVQIELVFNFLEFGGQGVACVTDLHWLAAGVGTASNKKTLVYTHTYIYIHMAVLNYSGLAKL